MKTQGLNFIEAVRQAKETGCEIRRDHWGVNVRVVSDERGELVFTNDSSPYHHVCGILADDWEVLPEEPPPKTMPFKEAMLALLEGKRVKRLHASWVYSFAPSDSNLIIDSLNAETDDWIIVEEPAPKQNIKQL